MLQPVAQPVEELEQRAGALGELEAVEALVGEAMWRGRPPCSARGPWRSRRLLRSIDLVVRHRAASRSATAFSRGAAGEPYADEDMGEALVRVAVVELGDQAQPQRAE